jgi:hypothetical protein
MKAFHEHRKTHDLINKKGSFDRESFVEYEPNYQQKLEHGEKKNQEVLQA